MVERIRSPSRQELIGKVEALHPLALDQLNHAIDYATANHGAQRRKSGDPFVVHPLEVAAILTDLRMDVPCITAGILHDILEDTQVTLPELQSEFGETVAKLVDGVTKLRRARRKSNIGASDAAEEQAENLRKMFLAMVSDIRVLIIKLADRLHNMRTLQYLSPETQLRKARETLEVFSPLASRLGIWQLKSELEDLAFRYLDPESYRKIAVPEGQVGRDTFYFWEMPAQLRRFKHHPHSAFGHNIDYPAGYFKPFFFGGIRKNSDSFHWFNLH